MINNMSLIESGSIVRGEVPEDDDQPFFGFDPAAEKLDGYEAVSRAYKNLIESLENDISDIQGLGGEHTYLSGGESGSSGKCGGDGSGSTETFGGGEIGLTGRGAGSGSTEAFSGSGSTGTFSGSGSTGTCSGGGSKGTCSGSGSTGTCSGSGSTGTSSGIGSTETVDGVDGVDLAWSFGSLIWEIFNPNESVVNAASNPLKNIPENLFAFYKKCLNKNPLKRPNSNMIQDLLLSCQNPSQFGKKIVKDLKAQDVKTARANVDLVEDMASASLSVVDRDSFIAADVADNQVISELRVGGVQVDESEVNEAARDVDDSDKSNDNICGAENGDGSVDFDKAKKRFVCSFCFRKYMHKSHLRRHLNAFHNSQLVELITQKLHQCKLCTKSYTKKHHLQRHEHQKHSSSGQNSIPKIMKVQFKPKPLSPYEKYREDRIREKRLFLDALDRET